MSSGCVVRAASTCLPVPAGSAAPRSNSAPYSYSATAVPHETVFMPDWFTLVVGFSMIVLDPQQLVVGQKPVEWVPHPGRGRPYCRRNCSLRTCCSH